MARMTSSGMEEAAENVNATLTRVQQTIKMCRAPNLTFTRRAELLTGCLDPIEQLRRTLVDNLFRQVIDHLAKQEAEDEGIPS